MMIFSSLDEPKDECSDPELGGKWDIKFYFRCFLLYSNPIIPYVIKRPNSNMPHEVTAKLSRWITKS